MIQENNVYLVWKQWRFEEDHDRDSDELSAIFQNQKGAEEFIERMVKLYDEENDFGSKEDNDRWLKKEKESFWIQPMKVRQ